MTTKLLNRDKRLLHSTPHREILIWLLCIQPKVYSTSVTIHLVEEAYMCDNDILNDIQLADEKIIEAISHTEWFNIRSNRVTAIDNAITNFIDSCPLANINTTTTRCSNAKDVKIFKQAIQSACEQFHQLVNEYADFNIEKDTLYVSNDMILQLNE